MLLLLLACAPEVSCTTVNTCAGQADFCVSYTTGRSWYESVDGASAVYSCNSGATDCARSLALFECQECRGQEADDACDLFHSLDALGTET